MIHQIFSISVVAISFVSMITATSYNAFESAFASLNYSLPKQWVITELEGKQIPPVFDTYLVEKTAIDHFKSNLKSNAKNFQVGFYYFDEQTLEQTSDRYSTGVRISLKAILPFNVSYSKANLYVVSKVGL